MFYGGRIFRLVKIVELYCGSRITLRCDVLMFSAYCVCVSEWSIKSLKWALKGMNDRVLSELGYDFFF